MSANCLNSEKPSLQTPVYAPVGVFDSGVGGLSVLAAIRQRLPKEQLIYFADSGFAPYGDKNPEEIQTRCHLIVDYLIEQGCKAIVVACNTATAAAIHHLRAQFELPIIGIEPGIKPAVLNSRSGRVGVLATRYTVNSERFQSLLAQFSAQAELTVQACPGLVETLELAGDHQDKLDSLLELYLEPMRTAGIDTLVLGCTHYSLLTAEIRNRLPGRVEILDTPLAVANQLQRRLQLSDSLSEQPEGSQPVRYISSSQDQRHSQALIQRLVGRRLSVESFNG